MYYLLVKALLSGIIIAAVSEIAKRSPGFGALVASLPMFLLIPIMLRHAYPFWVALAVGCVLTALLYLAMTLLGPRVGLRL